MAEREGTPEDFARLAAELRGQSQIRKAEADAPEPDTEAEEFLERLFAPKRGEVEFIRRWHGTEEE
jgi:hypothetical protein